MRNKLKKAQSTVYPVKSPLKRSAKHLNRVNCQPSTVESGFTLIEVILVLMMTAIVFVGIFALYANTIKNDVESRYEIIASNLAQEAVEIVRNVRDESVLNGGSNDGDIDDDLTVSPCIPYVDNVTGSSCNSSRSRHIELNNGLYRNALSDLTDPTFERYCDINIEDPQAKIIVECKVEWDSFVNSSIRRDVTVTSVLTDWR